MNKIWSLPRVLTFSLGLMSGVMVMVLLLFVLGFDLSWLHHDWIPIISIGISFGGLLGVFVMLLSSIAGNDMSVTDDKDSYTYGAYDGDVPTEEEFQDFMRNRKRGVQ